MTRIRLDMTMMDSIIAMVEGNPGALRVCLELLQDGGAIDPDSALGGFGKLLDLDTLGIYGPRIWMLYKDVCGEDLVKTVAALRAHQLGKLTRDTLDHAIDNYGQGLDCDSILASVQERLPRFGVNNNAEAAQAS